VRGGLVGHPPYLLLLTSYLSLFTSQAWGPAPPTLPAGAKAAVLEGDPKQVGPFTMRVSWHTSG
jgi:hypothetical protein